MQFKKYPRIQNHYNAKQLARLREAATEHGLIATEKIHGANFAVYVDSQGEYKFARRNGFLREDEEFYNYADAIAPTLLHRLRDCGVELCDRHCVDHVIFYGELYGSRVQKEIWYCDGVKFDVFDILVVRGDESRFLGWSQQFGVKQACTAFRIPRVPVVWCDYDAETLPREPMEFASWASELENQPAEGVVCIPDFPHSPEERELLGVKFKGKVLNERGGRKQKAPPTLSESEQAQFEALSVLICSARLASVRSKEAEGVHPRKLAGLVVRDALHETQERVSTNVRRALYDVALALV